MSNKNTTWLPTEVSKISAGDLARAGQNSNAWDGTSIEYVSRHLSANGSSLFPTLSEISSVRSEPIAPRQPYVRRFIVSDGVRTESVVAKRTRDPRSKVTEREFENYSRFQTIYGTSNRFRCPTPLAFLPDRSVLLTREERGPQLLQFLSPLAGKNAGRLLPLATAVESSAEFLKAFHSSRPRQQMSLESAWAQVAKATKPLWSGFADSEEFQTSLGSRLSHRVLSVRDSILDLRADLSCSVGAYHGDPAADNILVTKDSVVVLDAGRTDLGAQMQDIGFFTGNLALSSSLRLRSERWSGALNERFKAEYFGPLGPDTDDSIVVGLFELGAISEWFEQNLIRLNRIPVPARSVFRAHAKHVASSVLETSLVRTEDALKTFTA